MASHLTITNPPIQKLNEINKMLNEFVQQFLTPSSSYIERGNQHAQSIFNLLQSSSQFKISKTFIGGSIGKGTALGDNFNPDYDLVVLLNNEEPPFHNFLKIFGEELKLNGKRLFSNFVYLGVTKSSLKFEIGIYKFDLLPGANLTYNTSKEAQYGAVIAKIQKFNNPSSKIGGGLYSSSLVELCVNFTKAATPSVKSVIRLAKYWNKCVPIQKNVYINGRSTIIELVVISVHKGETETDLLTGFKRFLIAMTNLETLDVRFNYLYSRIPESVLRDTPCPRVFDPANPYNNMAHGLGKDKDSMRKFMAKAKETLGRLNSIGLHQMSVEGCIGPL